MKRALSMIELLITLAAVGNPYLSTTVLREPYNAVRMGVVEENRRARREGIKPPWETGAWRCASCLTDRRG